MAVNLNGITWDQLVNQAKAGYDTQSQWKGDAPTTGFTDIGGRAAQIYFGGSQQDPWLMNGNADRQAAADPWSNVTFNFKDPGKDKYMTNVSRGADGQLVTKDYLDTGDMGFAKDMAMFAASAYGMNGLVNGLGGLLGEAAATSGASGAAGSAASGVGEVVADQLPNEMAKLAAQNAAAPGTLLNTGLETISTAAGGTGLGSAVKTALDVAKGASLVNGIVNGGASQVADQTTTSRNSMDQRMEEWLYGNGKDAKGLLAQWMGTAGAPQNSSMQAFGQNAMDYTGKYGLSDMEASRNAAYGMMNSSLSAPQMGSATVANTPGMQAAQVANTPAMQAAQMQAAAMQAAQVNAPSQNNTNLQPAYTDMIYGERGNNPYLTGAIQKGINQSANAFGNMLQDQTKATQGLLSNINSGARVSGSYGGNRQALAQGDAIESFNTQMGRAMSQFGQNNTDAAVAAQAGAYDTDSNRALQAMSGLSQNQYGTAFQNAGFEQQANQTNAGFQQQANQTNAGLQQQANQTNYQGDLQSNLANAGYQNNANQTNYGGLLQSNLANAGYQQQGLSNNLNSQLTTQNLNSQRQQYGIGATQGLLDSAYGYGQNQDAYGLGRASQQAGLLGPFTGLNSTSTNTQPLYQNKAGNLMAGVTAGATVYDLAKKYLLD